MDNERTDRRNRRRLGILAGIAGGLLLLGGTTYALWSDSAVQTGGVITNGNLDVEPVGSPTYWDVSADRSDRTATTPVTALSAHTVTLSGYTIVPGDKLEANYPFAIALSGDNLVAGVSVSMPSLTAATGVTFSGRAYYLSGSTWTAMGAATTLTAGSATTIATGNFQAANQAGGALEATPQGNPAIPVIPLAAVPGTGATANVAIVITATFDAATTGRAGVNASSTLGDVTVALNQTRTAGTGSFIQ